MVERIAHRGEIGRCDVGARKDFVALCGGESTQPVVLSGFGARQAADDFAREIGGALRLPLKDLVETEPDDPVLDTDAEAEGAKAQRKGRRTAAAAAV